MAETVVQGLSADDSRIPSKWNRQTVADGDWLQKKTLAPLSARDVYLAEQIDKGNGDVTYVSGKVDELSGKTLVLSGELNSTSSFLSGAIDSVSAGVDFVSAGVDGVSSIFDDFHTNEYEQFVRDVTQSAADLDGKIDDVASDLADEIVDRTNADTELQNQIDKLEAATDVICVYGTYSGYENSFSNASGDLFKEPEHLTENDVIKVLNDNSDTGEGGQTYWQATNVDWETSSCDWTRIGKLEPYYTKSEINTITGNIATDISNTYLSAKGAVHQGKNIVVTEDSTKPEITISTSADVEFTNVSSTNISATNVTALTANGNSAKFTNFSSTNLTSNNISSTKTTATTAYITNLSGASKSDTVDNLFGSAYSGAEASAWIYTNSARLDIQAGYGLETGEDDGHLVIGLHQDSCEYNKYGLALGTYSIANSINIGNASFAFGEYCNVIGGQGTFAAGSNVDITGRFSCGIGDYSDINGNYSYSIGEHNNLTADRQYAFGQGLSGNSFMIGRYNEVEPNAQFVIGGGTTGAYSVTSHKNLLVIKNDVISARDFSAGNVSLSSLTNISAFGNGITNTATFNLSAVKLSAGQGIGFKNDTNGVLSISAEGRAYTGENYVKVDNTTKKISLSGDLVNSAQSGQSAYNWITTKSATLQAGQGIGFYSAGPNILGISAAGASYIDGNYIHIDTSNNSINLSSNISANNISSQYFKQYSAVGQSQGFSVTSTEISGDYFNMHAGTPSYGSELEFDSVNLSVKPAQAGVFLNTTWQNVVNVANGKFGDVTARSFTTSSTNGSITAYTEITPDGVVINNHGAAAGSFVQISPTQISIGNGAGTSADITDVIKAANHDGYISGNNTITAIVSASQAGSTRGVLYFV